MDSPSDSVRTRGFHFWESDLIFQGVRDHACRHPSVPEEVFVIVPGVVARTWECEFPTRPERASRTEHEGWLTADIPPRHKTECELRFRPNTLAVLRSDRYTGNCGRGVVDRNLAFGLHLSRVDRTRRSCSKHAGQACAVQVLSPACREPVAAAPARVPGLRVLGLVGGLREGILLQVDPRCT